MGTGISSNILGLHGQRVNEIKLDHEKQKVLILCSRNRRYKAVDPVTGTRDDQPVLYAGKYEISPCLAIRA